MSSLISKKRKRSFFPAECSTLFAQLLHLAESLLEATKNCETGDDNADDNGKIFITDDFLSTLKSTHDSGTKLLTLPRSLSFSNMTESGLDTLKLYPGPGLVLKDQSSFASQQPEEPSPTNPWSSDFYRRHLAFLVQTVPRSNETSAREYITAVIYRASALLPEGLQLILNMEKSIPYTEIPGKSVGVLDYAGIIADRDQARVYRSSPLLRIAKLCTAFYVVEAKYGTLPEHIPQIVSQLFGSAKQLRKKFIRGVLTNGLSWVFVALATSDDWSHGIYNVSEALEWGYERQTDGDVEVSLLWPDIIATVLAEWFVKGFEDLSANERFRLIS